MRRRSSSISSGGMLISNGRISVAVSTLLLMIVPSLLSCPCVLSVVERGDGRSDHPRRG
jgi:hypothetical protein